MKLMANEGVVVKYGLVTALLLVIYFLLMKSMGLANATELRVFNLLFMILGLYFVLDKYREQSGEKMDYLTGLGMAFGTALITAGLFSLFVGFYLFFDTDFMEYLRHNAWMGHYLNPITSGFAVFGEGISSGMIGAFILMQWYKKYAQDLVPGI